jgi:hypothetical protein
MTDSAASYTNTRKPPDQHGRDSRHPHSRAHLLLDQPIRRTVRDYERLPQHHAAMVQWAMIIIMTRRLANHHVT